MAFPLVAFPMDFRMSLRTGFLAELSANLPTALLACLAIKIPTYTLKLRTLTRTLVKSSGMFANVLSMTEFIQPRKGELLVTQVIPKIPQTTSKEVLGRTVALPC
ncbi:hypothetical protein D8792_10275 [Streptococcus cristatus]|uniref:Uncharacterized protein n=1 Tax=Streptococcus cristatus TaxID=45634 RepID=A0A428GVX4_STRCR|nr:hypothetical protein D8792_10275 [Streptococcus cristatus]